MESVPEVDPETRKPAHPASPEMRIMRLLLPLDSIINSPAQMWPEQRKSTSFVSSSKMIFLQIGETE